MLGLFKSRPFHDAQLGEFVRTRGHWRGSVSLDSRPAAPLVMAGDRSQPDARALSLARGLSQQTALIEPLIAQALFEHYQPYAEAVTDGDEPPPTGGLPRITSPAEVWPHVDLLFVSIAPLDGALTVEFGYSVAWDEEHTLGARFRDGRFLELCGSVLSP